MSTAVRAWSATLAVIAILAAVVTGLWLTFSDVTEYWSLLQVIGAGAAFVAVIVLVAAALVVLALKRSSDDLYRERRLLELYHDLAMKIDAVEVIIGHSREDVTHKVTETLTLLKEIVRNTEPKRREPKVPVKVTSKAEVVSTQDVAKPTRSASRRRVL